MSLNYIRRPDISSYSNEHLFQIICNYDKGWTITNVNPTRIQMVEKIFSLWAEHELLDIDFKPISCLICDDALVQGNHMTFECGHQFHCSCIIKFILVKTSEKSIRDYSNDKINTLKLDFNCPQCNTNISTHLIDKSCFVLDNDVN